jgi:AcrR family transcriptional regulator
VAHVRHRDEGVEAVTVRAVAARAGIAPSSLRHQYRDKDFLLRCVIHECTERFNRATYTFRPSGDPVRDVVDLLATQLPRDEDELANALMWLALVDRSRAIEILRLHAHQLRWLARTTTPRSA